MNNLTTIELIRDPAGHIHWWRLFVPWVLLSCLLSFQDPASSRPAPSQGQDAKKVEAPTTRIPRDGCVTSDCHAGVKDHQILHGPVNVNACDGCHNLIDVEKHEYRLHREKQGLCAHCHDPKLTKGNGRHEPFDQGDCLACHNPHGGQNKALLAQRNYAETCLSCHAQSVKDKLYGHGPANAGSCGACHEPHASDLPKLLSKTGRGLCLGCHVSIDIELSTKPLVHPPAQGECEICHDPHATDNIAHLKQPPLALCTSCHKDIQHQVDLSKTEHGALTTKQSCTTCHDPHASTRSHLLEKDTVDLCKTCHDKEVVLPDGGKLSNIWRELTDAKSIHAPVEDGSCAFCHRIHGGTNERLLPEGTSTKTYSTDGAKTYELCFECHDRNLVDLEKTRATTGFRNESLNLHFVHVHRDKKGRSCRICHASHGSPNPALLRDSFGYGPAGWQLRIGWKRSKTGGSCGSGCHAPFGYDRNKAIENPRYEKLGPDWKGERLPKDKGDPDRKKSGSATDPKSDTRRNGE